MQAAPRKENQTKKFSELDLPYSEFLLTMLHILADRNCHHCRQRGYIGLNARSGYVIYCRCLSKKVRRYISLSKNMKYKKHIVDNTVGRIQYLDGKGREKVRT